MSRLENPAPTETVAEDDRAILTDQWRVASAVLNAVPGTTMPEDALAALRAFGNPADESG